MIHVIVILQFENLISILSEALEDEHDLGGGGLSLG